MSATRPVRIRLLGAGLALGGLTAMTTAGPVWAAPPDRFDVVYEDAVVYEDFCGVEGLDVTRSFYSEGTAMLKSGKPGTLPRYSEHLRSTSWWTNADGDVVIETGLLNSSDLEVIDNGDGTATVTVLNTGNATYLDAEGEVLGRNPGQVRLRFVIGPDGLPVSREIVKESTGRTDDFCAIALPILG